MHRWIAVGSLALALLSGACAQSEPSSGGGGDQAPAPVPPQAVSFTIDDKKVTELPQDVSAGIVEATVTNDGKDKHFVVFARLNPDVTQEKFLKAFPKGFPAFFPLLRTAGAVHSPKGNIAAGGSESTVVEFTEGEYLAIDPEAKGFKPGFFTVGPAVDENVEEPESEYQIDEGEYFIKVDEELPAGRHTFVVTNVGEQSHELIVFNKKNDEDAGFTIAAVPGSRTWMELDLKPGVYTFACFFPDVKDGKMGKKNHAKLGMKTTVTVK